MAQDAMWGWYPDGNKWVKLRVDEDGSFHVVGYIDNLEDIGDVILTAIANNDVLYWVDPPGEWRNIAHLGIADAHHAKYTDAEAVDAMGVIGDANPLHHNRATEWGAAEHAAIGNAAPHHSEAHDLASHTTKAHAELTNVTPAQHHAKYTDGEAVSAVEAAGLALASGKNIQLYTALANLEHSGLTAVGTAAITDADGIGKACYVNGSGKIDHADKDSAATMPCSVLQTSDTTADESAVYLLQGFIRQNTWDWTPGGIIYVGDDGALTQDVSGYTTGDQVQVVGVALSADVIYFNPSYELVEIS